MKPMTPEKKAYLKSPQGRKNMTRMINRLAKAKKIRELKEQLGE